MPLRSRHILPGQGVKIGDLVPAVGAIRYADMGLWHGPGREHLNFGDYTYQAKFESTTPYGRGQCPLAMRYAFCAEMPDLFHVLACMWAKVSRHPRFVPRVHKSASGSPPLPAKGEAALG